MFQSQLEFDFVGREQPWYHLPLKARWVMAPLFKMTAKDKGALLKLEAKLSYKSYFDVIKVHAEAAGKAIAKWKNNQLSETFGWYG